MTAADLTPFAPARPGLAAVFVEHLRTVGAAARRELLVLAAGVTVMTVLMLAEIARHGAVLDMWRGELLVFNALGLVFPWAVWKGEKVFAGAWLWALPVDRRVNALLKVAAGLVWLLAVTALLMAWMVSLALVSGGEVGTVHTLLVTAPGAAPAPLAWAIQPWQWIAPFVGAAVSYLAGSAVLLGVKHPFRWAAAAGACLFVMAELRPTGLFEHALDALFLGPVGLDQLLTGGLEGLDADVTLADGTREVVWSGLPAFGRWFPAIAFWLASACLGLFAAVSRHRE